MRIIWNPEFKQFEAQLASGMDWQAEQEAVKKAGFRGEGPPDWKWVAFRAAVLEKLKELKPLTLMITTEALEHYKRLKTQEDANKVVLKQLKEAKKKSKAENLEYTQDKLAYDEFSYVKMATGESIILQKYAPPLPSAFCSVCKTAVYYYECQDPLLCLDCEFADDI